MNPEKWRSLRDDPKAASKFEYWQYWMNNKWPEKFQDFGFFMRRYNMNSFSNYLSNLSTNDETTRYFVKLLVHSKENLNDLSVNVLTHLAKFYQELTRENALEVLQRCQEILYKSRNESQQKFNISMYKVFGFLLLLGMGTTLIGLICEKFEISAVGCITMIIAIIGFLAIGH